MTEKSPLDIVQEYKFNTMFSCLGNERYKFQKQGKENICNIFRHNAIISCPSWTGLKGTFDRFFSEDPQLNLFDNDENLTKAHEVIDVNNLAMIFTLKDLHLQNLNLIFNCFSNFDVSFKYAGKVGQIEVMPTDGNPLTWSGLEAKNKKLQDPVTFEPASNLIFKLFRFFKTLTSHNEIRDTGLFRIFHNTKYTGFQMNWILNDKQREIITAISLNKAAVEDSFKDQENKDVVVEKKVTKRKKKK